MGTLEQFSSACEEWKQLTEEEGAALEINDWAKVHDCQERKARIRNRVETFGIESWGVKMVESLRLRKQIDELVELEKQNAALLKARQAAVAGEIEEIKNQSRTLGQVRRSYGRGREGVWAGYC